MFVCMYLSSSARQLGSLECVGRNISIERRLRLRLISGILYANVVPKKHIKISILCVCNYLYICMCKDTKAFGVWSKKCTKTNAQIQTHTLFRTLLNTDYWTIEYVDLYSFVHHPLSFGLIIMLISLQLLPNALVNRF